MSDAYDRTLAAIHAWVVRAGIKTGMMALPTREAFLASIGETGGHPGGGVLAGRACSGCLPRLPALRSRLACRQI